MNRAFNFVRAVLHTALLAVTVVPWALAAVLLRVLGQEKWCYAVCINWLRLSVNSGTAILGIHNRVTGWENLPKGETDAAILLVKHQSLWETFTMIAIMPHPLAYVFKKELLRIPFFGWAIGSLDMIHIDRKQGTQAFTKVVEQGKRLLDKGTWVIMFPEGTRTARGQQGVYKTGGTRLAIETGAPVVPVAVTSAKCWPKKAFIKTPGIVDISIGKPISSVGREPAELMREVEAWIEAEMRRLDAQAYSSEPNT
jgi:1-acyl-sn-glycerol-3-phosphate acyltransferase